MGKVQKIREEVARIQLFAQSGVLKQILDFIDSLQEEPVSKKDYKCPKCGGHMTIDMSAKTASVKPMYYLRCDNCRYLDFVDCDEVEKEEPVSEDLKKAANNALEGLLDKYDLVGTGSCLEMFKLGARWQKEQNQSTIELAEDHAMLAGMEKMKEQMMKGAVEVTVHIDAGNYPYIPQMELYDYDKDVPLAKKGDKYKVILIKDN